MAKGGFLSKPIRDWTFEELKANPLAAKAAKKHVDKVENWIQLVIRRTRQRYTQEKQHLEWQRKNPQPKPTPKPGWKPRRTKQQKETWQWIKDERQRKKDNTG